MSLCNLQRILISKNWSSQWINNNKKVYQLWVQEDVQLRNLINQELEKYIISSIIIQRLNSIAHIHLHCVKSTDLNKNETFLKKFKLKLQKLCSLIIDFKIITVDENIPCANVIAFNMVEELKNAFSLKKVLNKQIQLAMKLNIKGIIIILKGRLTGDNKSQYEKISDGAVTKNNLCKKVDYASKSFVNQFGKCGLKVWITLN